MTKLEDLTVSIYSIYDDAGRIGRLVYTIGEGRAASKSPH
jgi:hypothetical protein